MSLAGNFFHKTLARQYAWNLHRFADDARANTEASVAFIAIIPATFLATVLIVPALLWLKVQHLYIAGPILFVLGWFISQRAVNKTFVTNHSEILAAADAINEDPARGPGWALKRQWLAIAGSLLVLTATMVVIRIAVIQLNLVATPDQFRQLAQASQYYRSHRSGLDELADQLEQDTTLVEVVCEETRMEVRLVDAEYPVPMTEDQLAVYEPLCGFAKKVNMKRTARGVRIPYYFYEHGNLFVLVYLERRQDVDIQYPQCSAELLRTAEGHCDVPLNASWTVTYRWQPF